MERKRKITLICPYCLNEKVLTCKGASEEIVVKCSECKASFLLRSDSDLNFTLTGRYTQNIVSSTK